MFYLYVLVRLNQEVESSHSAAFFNRYKMFIIQVHISDIDYM